MAKKILYSEIKNYINSFITGNGCKLITSQEDFELEKIKQNKSGAKVKLKVQCGCENNNIFEVNFDKFKSKNKKQCNNCSNCERLTIDVVKNKLILKEISIISKKFSKSKSLKFKCNKCNHIFNMTWYNLMEYGCPNCRVEEGNVLALSLEQKKNNLKDINPNIIIKSIVYINITSDLNCYCLICNSNFKKCWKYLQQGVGCPKCSNEEKRKKRALTLEQVISKLKIINKNIKILSLSYINSNQKLECECLICNGKFKKRWKHLQMGIGCPECDKKLGEKAICDYLINNKIKYIEQYKFKDCKNKRPLPFDFYLPEFNILIEYDGEQHFKPVDFFGGKERFKIQQKHDDIKNKYCSLFNIKLIRIPYWDFKKIDVILEEGINIKNKVV